MIEQVLARGHATTTDRILDAVRAEIERQRTRIDGTDTLHRVEIAVMLNRGQKVFRVRFRTEDEKDLLA